MLIHELTHGLGFDHIEANFGAANMNPNCCVLINQLDIDCLDYTYPPAPLPVELVAFTAVPQTNDVLLTWSTATEINNDQFQVQRSADGQHFHDLATIPGQGTTSSPHQYTYLDRRPGPGQWYYRLRQVDLDGQATFSSVVTVQLKSESAVSRVYPNPVGGQTITVQRQSPVESEVHVDIIGLDQMVVKQHRLHQRKGANLWEIVLPDIQPGVYLLRLVDDQQTEVIYFMVANP